MKINKQVLFFYQTKRVTYHYLIIKKRRLKTLWVAGVIFRQMQPFL